MGAVITAGHRIISSGYNEHRSHPAQKALFNPKRELHAEISTIISCPRDLLEGATIYVVRKDRTIKGMGVMLSRPCEMCYEAIEKAGIEKIIYSISGNLLEGPINWGTIKIRS